MPDKQISTHSKNIDKMDVDWHAPPLEKLIAEIASETENLTNEDSPQACDFLNNPEQGQYKQIQYIRFSVSDKVFAVPLESALEIGERPSITPIPNIPEWILGISNIRGEIVSMVDLCRFLNIGIPQRITAPRYVVLHNQHIKIGVLVDQILGMLTLSDPESEIQKSPYIDGEFALYTKGVIPFEKKPVNIIDIERMLMSSKMLEFQT